MPVVAKLCDFGFAVILSDYRSGRPFQARIGTWPWISPELDLSISTPGDLLHKSDIYSCGLLLASILENGKTPFGGMTEAGVRQARLNISACDIIRGGIQSGTDLTRCERAKISIILVETLAPLPHQRVSLETLTAQWSIIIEENLKLEHCRGKNRLRELLYARYRTESTICPSPIPALESPPKTMPPGEQLERGSDEGKGDKDDDNRKLVPVVPDVSVSPQETAIICSTSEALL
jgi:serine/threonine protein kinase